MRKGWWYALVAVVVIVGSVATSLIASEGSHTSRSIQTIGPTLSNVFYPSQLLVTGNRAWILYSGGTGTSGGVRALQLSSGIGFVTVNSSHLEVPTAMTMFDGSLWIAQSLDGVSGSPDLLKVDPATGRVQDEFVVLGDPVGLVASHGVLYVLNDADGSVTIYSVAGVATGGFTLSRVPAIDSSMFGVLGGNKLVVVANTYPFFGYVALVSLDSHDTDWSNKVAGSLGPPLVVGSNVYVEQVSSRSTSIDEYSLENGSLVQSTKVAEGASGESAPNFLDTVDGELIFGVSGLKEVCAMPIDGHRVAVCRQLQGIPDDAVVSGSDLYLFESIGDSATSATRAVIQRITSFSKTFG